MQEGQISLQKHHFMKDILFKFLSSFLCLVTLVGCSQKNDKLKIATAANMQFAMKELIDAFEKEKGIEADMILSSSGKLTAQIEAGAPFDLFFSADTKYPKQLAAKGLSSDPQVYAYGQLVSWFKKDEYQFELYAMANPRTAPYGRATEEYLRKIEKELPDVVYGESISQVNQFLLSGTVDAGFTSLSSVMSNKFSAEGKWILLPDSLYSPIAQAYVILDDSDRKNEAAAFIDFLASGSAKGILETYGYKLN